MNPNEARRPDPATDRAADRRASKHRRTAGWLRRSLSMTLACGVVLGGGTVTVTEQLFAPAPAAQAATSVSGIINSYQAVSAVSGKNVTVTGSITGAGTAFKVGDQVMLIQMTGVSPAVAGSNFGHYDNTTITAISGSTITLAAITKGYSPSTEKVQLVRTYTDTGTTTVTGDVKAKPWDGTTGGVISMAGQTLQLNANIDASGVGFTRTNPPTTQVVAPLSSGQGEASGRGQAGLVSGRVAEWPKSGGGGIGGGGGIPALTYPKDSGTGGGIAGGAAGGPIRANSINYDPGPKAAGVDGGAGELATGWSSFRNFLGAWGGAGGAGGIIGGGGGGGGGLDKGLSGAGGGTDGGGAGGTYELYASADGMTILTMGGGGGGTRSVGNGGDGPKGGPSGTGLQNSTNEGGAGGGGGSYGGGGGAPNNWGGGDDANGGGGGGSWFGGGRGGKSTTTRGRFTRMEAMEMRPSLGRSPKTVIT